MTTDPRHANTRQFMQDSAGKVVGVELQILRMIHAKYELVDARLVDEYEANGQTIATVSVYKKGMTPALDRVRLAWPWNGSTHFSGGGYPGNPSIPAVHIIVNKFWPPSLGPLAIYVGDPGDIRSDVVGGLGLPMGHHVSFQLTFKERGDSPSPPPDPVPPSDLAERVARLETELRNLRNALRSV